MKITAAGMYGDKLVVEFGDLPRQLGDGSTATVTYDFSCEASMEAFAALCRDVGIMNPTDTSQLIGKEITNNQQETTHGV